MRKGVRLLQMHYKKLGFRDSVNNLYYRTCFVHICSCSLDMSSALYICFYKNGEREKVCVCACMLYPRLNLLCVYMLVSNESTVSACITSKLQSSPVLSVQRSQFVFAH